MVFKLSGPGQGKKGNEINQIGQEIAHPVRVVNVRGEAVPVKREA
jgi:hypothetical protein